MILVHAFCHKDWEGAVRFFEWCRQLNSAQDPHPAVLVCNRGVRDGDRLRVVRAAQSAFAQVGVVVPSEESAVEWNAATKDASGPNLLFRAAADYMQRERGDSWLWTEPDVVPLVPGALHAIESEYARARKPFMGYIYPVPFPHINGVAVYPPKVSRYNSLMIYGPPDVPWDLMNAQATLDNCHVTALIQRSLADPATKTAHTFNSQEDMAVLNPEAVLFHGCADGSLMRLLKGNERPRLHVDRNAPPMAFTAQFAQEASKTEPTPIEIPVFVQLGRAGDILNILPVVRLFHGLAHHHPIPVVVHSTMASATLRAGYVEPLIWHGEINDREKAVAHYRQRGRFVMVPQLFHENGVDRCCNFPHYNIDQWELCGAGKFWGQFPLEFDQRDFRAETEFYKASHQTDQPLIAYNLSGLSSPFAGAKAMEQWLRREFSDCELLDLDARRTVCIADQLGLLDRCHILVTSDTATLHLAQGSCCPYVAFLSDQSADGWKASATRRPPLFAAAYGQVESRKRELKTAIESCVRRSFPNRKVWHCVPLRDGQEDARRKRISMHLMRIWNEGIVEPIQVRTDLRNARSILGDNRTLPFLRDILQVALIRCRPDDILIFANDDVVFTELAVQHLRLQLRHCNMVTGARVDVNQMPDILNGGVRGHRHLGRDLLAFNVGWLQQHLELIPDFILGASEWDITLGAIARKLMGMPMIPENIGMVFPECELPVGTVVHEQHVPLWNRPGQVDASPSQIHNRTLSEEWFRHNSRMALHWFNRV